MKRQKADVRNLLVFKSYTIYIVVFRCYLREMARHLTGIVCKSITY